MAPSNDTSNHCEFGKIGIVIVGDSTVATYLPKAGNCGWGQMLPEFFSDSVVFVTLAGGGQSSKSFIEQGRWEDALARKADYVFIQFGHNDCPGKGDRETDPQTTFMDNIRKFVDDARHVDARPILITPPTRRRFGTDGKIQTILRPYALAMIEVASEKNAPLVDLHAKSVRRFNTLGNTRSEDYNCSPTDCAHWSAKGARIIAQLIVEELATVEPSLKPYMRQNT